MDGIKHYRRLLENIERFAEGWRVEPPFPLSCRPGCDGCCRARLSVFAVEAAAIRQAVAGRVAEIRSRMAAADDGACPFLRDGECLIYAFRPVICRTQGYPVTYRGDAGERLADLCPVTPPPPAIIPPARVLDLETLNHVLGSINRFHLSAMERRGRNVPSRVDLLAVLDDNP